MEITHYLSHNKINNMFLDYYEQTKQWVVKYVLKVDGKTVYEWDEQLDKDQMILLSSTSL